VVIADASFGMLKEAPRAALKPVCGGSESLPFADNSFERVIMVDVLHHVIHHADSAREMFRVLKPGGILVIEEPDIRTFGVKLIALAEKLLLMRSHFLTPDAIMKLFSSGKKKMRAEDGTAWVVIKKVTFQA
jgi:demethylmenaquinone methyltransferase/2-methoxy-6-polyprenyl-1,4-benzoquinol methylase